MEKITVVDAPSPRVKPEYVGIIGFGRANIGCKFVISTEARNLFAAILPEPHNT